ncbi:MAG: hypothetical protein ABF562_05145 [Gluconobacter japonicus]|uniref:hypothetical protein n=2 Tax=Gluconobacter japonicus TaxID=376620 RepID=UPI00029A8157|nr:hypothetical protein [Gluconobacter japonicus]GAP25208.1 hypothetical protein GLF_2090 [Gluconobacter frateurii NBRC 101659]
MTTGPRMQVTRSEDGQKIVLSFLENSGLTGDITLDEAQLTQLITSLGLARTALVEQKPLPPIEGARFSPVYKTNWALQIDTLTEGSLLAFQHPAYGPVGLVFTPTDAERLIGGLQRHRTMVHSSPDDARKPS